MKLPVDLRFVGMPPSNSAEEAVHRRIQRLNTQYPFVLNWVAVLQQTCVAGPTAAGYALRLQAQLAGGALLAASGHGADLQAVVRDAFRAIEADLEEERRGARVQAARWLSAVRSRAAAMAAPPH